MTKEEVLRLSSLGETSTVQFKERIYDAYKIACEMVAFSNTRGGMIIIGVNDKTGQINGLSFDEIKDSTTLLTSASTENVSPSIRIDIETVPMDEGTVIVANIPDGRNKPYRDNKGIIWVKNGQDKRRVFDNVDLVEMLMDNGQLSPDGMPVKGTSTSDLLVDAVKEYILQRFHQIFKSQKISSADLWKLSIDEIVRYIGPEQTIDNVLMNAGLVLPDGTLTVAALILMGKYPQRWLPAFTARCVSFVGNSIGGTEFRDKSSTDADGNVIHLYKYIMSFLTRNLRTIQTQEDFNSPGELEVSTATLSELIVNSILHRSYVIEAPIRVLVFDNRIEIHSPGLLPKGVNLENIKHGISVPRNKLMFSNGVHLLPYTGVGSGITRAMMFTPNIKFDNNELLNEFVVTILRDNGEEHGGADGEAGDANVLKDSKINKADKERFGEDGGANGEAYKERIQYKDLSKVQKNIIQYCTIPRTAREILEHIDYKYHSDLVSKLIKPLIAMGYLEYTVPDKPKSPNQKYRSTKRNH